MANEPERPIEKLLRAAAKKRRDEAGAPLELHPATRRLLQGEVARTFAKPKPETRTFSEVLGQLWRRFAWAAAICAVLVVAGYILLPFPGKGRPEGLLAKNEPMPQAAPAKKLLPLPALAKDSRAASTDRDVHEKLAAPVTPQLADRKKAAEANVAPSRGTLTQAPSGTVNGAY